MCESVYICGCLASHVKRNGGGQGGLEQRRRKSGFVTARSKPYGLDGDDDDGPRHITRYTLSHVLHVRTHHDSHTQISKGCGEQLMSRDVRFVGAHTDFFRSASLYNTGERLGLLTPASGSDGMPPLGVRCGADVILPIASVAQHTCTLSLSLYNAPRPSRSTSLPKGPGHFINTWVTVYTIRAGLWVMLLLLLGGVAEGSGDIAAAIGAVQILQVRAFVLHSLAVVEVVMRRVVSWRGVS